MEDKIDLINELETKKEILKLEKSQKRIDKFISLQKLSMATIIILLVVLLSFILVAVLVHPSLPSNTLGLINNFPNSVLFSVANQLMNGSIVPSSIGLYPLNPYSITVNPIISNGKDNIYFVGATSCQYCARTRIPLSIALAKFGSFNKIYGGYSVGDGDYPTIFWTDVTTNGYDNGAYYTSKYVNFIVTDAYEPDGFSEPNTVQTELSYPPIMRFLNLSQKYINISTGIATPLMLIGGNLVNGAPTSTPPPLTTGSYFSPLSSGPQQAVTPAILLSIIQADNTTYSTDEIAGADMYIASICKAINMSAPICSEYNWTAFYNRFG